MEEEMKIAGEYYCYNAFYKLWRDVFPYIKLRKYKQVTGRDRKLFMF